MPRRATRQPDGFTILEILLVVAGLAIAGGLLVLAYNPGRQLAQTRNAERRSDVAQLVNAVAQYQSASGSLPTLPSTPTEICVTGAETCEGLVDLAVLTKNRTYLNEIPTDPTAASTNGSGYTIVVTNGTILVAAPHAELGATISSSR